MKMKFLLSSMALFAALNCIGQIEREEKIYKSVDGRDLAVDIFFNLTAKDLGALPAIAFFHGGGWVFGDRSEFYQACERYAMQGFVCCSFEYRLSINPDGTYPHPDITPLESVKDARSAIRWLKENADELGIDRQRIVAGGQSAGGQLTLSTVLMDKINEPTDNLEVDPTPSALLLFSSSVNTMEAWIDMLLGDQRERIWDISPYHNLRGGMPPAIAFHGEDDCTVLPYIVDLFKTRMQQLGNPYELVTYPGKKHYLGEGSEKYARYFDEEILERTDEFLRNLGFIETR